MGLEWTDDNFKGDGKPPEFGPGFVAMVLLILVIGFIIWQTK